MLLRTTCFCQTEGFERVGDFRLFFIAFFYPLCYIFVVKNRFYPFFTHGNKEKSRKPKKIKAFETFNNAGGETVPPVFLCLAIPTQPPQNVSK